MEEPELITIRFTRNELKLLYDAVKYERMVRSHSDELNIIKKDLYLKILHKYREFITP